MMNKISPPSDVSGQKNSGYDFDFIEWPFYWLARADRLYVSTIERALSAIELDIPRWRVLMVLHSRKSASVSELSDHSIVKLPTMTKIIQRMTTDGMVTSAPSETDRRVTMVTITSEGEVLGQKASEIALRVMRRSFESFSEAEVEQFVALLKKLAGVLEHY